MLEKLKEIIADQLSVDESEIELSTSFKDDLGADSLDLYELVMALEEEYGCDIPADFYVIMKMYPLHTKTAAAHRVAAAIFTCELFR